MPTEVPDTIAALVGTHPRHPNPLYKKPGMGDADIKIRSRTSVMVLRASDTISNLTFLITAVNGRL